MSIRFNAEEILGIAVTIEQNGRRFYVAAAEKISDAGPHAMLNMLAQREEEHERVFAMLRDDLTDAEREATTYDPADELGMYLQTFANEKVFPLNEDPLANLGDEPTYTEILRTAIGMEKDSIALYVGLRDLVTDSKGKGKVDEILREEMAHVAQLSGELAKLRE